MDTTSSPIGRLRQPTMRSRYLLAKYNVDSDMQVDGAALLFTGVILLLVTLLLALLFLCARWVVRRCRNSPPPSNPVTHEAAPKPNLDPVAIDGLPVVMYGATAEARPAGAECCICLGMYGDADEVKILPQCRHCFHSECVDEWLKNQSSCPLCRDRL